MMDSIDNQGFSLSWVTIKKNWGKITLVGTTLVGFATHAITTKMDALKMQQEIVTLQKQLEKQGERLDECESFLTHSERSNHEKD